MPYLEIKKMNESDDEGEISGGSNNASANGGNKKNEKRKWKNVNVKVGTVKAANDASGGGDEGGKADGFAPGGNDARGLGNKAALTKWKNKVLAKLKNTEMKKSGVIGKEVV